MEELTNHQIQMPPSKGFPKGSVLKLKENVLVVVGANGSGKTRFGAWLDGKQAQLHHRVSAHRSLTFPTDVNAMDLVKAERLLLTGYQELGNYDHYKNSQRWQQNPATALLNDFTALVTYLISDESASSIQYRQNMKVQNTYVSPPPTRLDVVKRIWETILPQRKLHITGNRIEAFNQTGEKSYHAKEMSDGERSIFHLIAEALSVPQDGVFIIDEPELHLHRSIQSRLWDSIELERQDCIFVYITHDLDFASSRKNATKVWLREYSDGLWDWEELPELDELPEPLYLEVIGSRKPILFVEGNKGSLDYLVYNKVYTGFTVVPCGSCEAVIHCTSSFNNHKNFHHIMCAGIVDNDGRTDEEVESLRVNNVFVLDVAFIENLFLTEPVVRLAATTLSMNASDVVKQLTERVLSQLRNSYENVISYLTRQEIETKLRRFGKSPDGTTAIESHYKSTCDAIDPNGIYRSWSDKIDRILSENDYSGALRYYKNKGLSKEADAIFSMRYQQQVRRWMNDSCSSKFIAAFEEVIPKLKEL